MKKVLICILSALITLSLSSCSKANKEFITGNLKTASDLKVSVSLDYDKNGVKMYEAYADQYVFSFIIDLSAVENNFGISFVDTNGNIKYFNAGGLGNNIMHIDYPNYDLQDTLMLGELTRQNGVYSSEIEIPLKEFFPGITSKAKTTYDCDGVFLFDDQLYRVDSLVCTDCFYILKFDKNYADPQTINESGISFSFYDTSLENHSSYFIDDYTYYLYDPLKIEGSIYLKIDDRSDIFTINLK